MKVKQEVIKEEAAADLASGEEQMKDSTANAVEAPSSGGDEEQEEEKEDFVAPNDKGSWSVPIMHEIEVATLEEVEALEDRIYHASLQAKVRLSTFLFVCELSLSVEHQNRIVYCLV